MDGCPCGGRCSLGAGLGSASPRQARPARLPASRARGARAECARAAEPTLPPRGALQPSTRVELPRLLRTHTCPISGYLMKWTSFLQPRSASLTHRPVWL
ncbi:unnamed protein product [Prorocentrum cordatum]|uniref:Uncharacterized protein n=1 Tax=Prorocentrum cordatum TaxID=2364126 RepID=A0ABN9PA53_9DINO|nr:unnamed protein product [Polarella glacialis]